ncbi:hypothetical protein [Microbacterium sp. NPDC058389]|uniref:hypothetical protein n=1 Tax=Microbacterium sp. NPDC058389 TaxID=3346475 RepID=UPI00365E1709
MSRNAVIFHGDQPANVEGARLAGIHAERWTHTDGIPALLAILDKHGVRVADEP